MTTSIGNRFKSGVFPPIAGIAAALFLTIASSAAFAVPTVFLEPESTFVGAGQEFIVRLSVNAEVDTFSNFQVIVAFDPAIVALDSVERGSLYLAAGYQDLWHVEEESLGTWEIFEVIFPFDAFIIAPGELAVIHFHALALGTTPIEFLSATVMDIDREAILPLDAIGATVTVEELVGVESGVGNRGMWDLGMPFPNPAPGAASIRLGRPAGADFDASRLAVYDLRGRLVRALEPGAGNIEWNGRDSRGEDVPAGVYFFVLRTREGTESRKIVLVR